MYLYMVSARILNMGALGGAVTIYMYSIPYGQFLGTRFSLEHLFFYGTLYGNDVNLRNSMGYIYNMYILLLLLLIIIIIMYTHCMI